MSTTEKPTTTVTPQHYHVWRGGPSAGEVTVMLKCAEPFPTRKSALSWLRDRRGKLDKVIVCRDKACPEVEPVDDDTPASTSPF